MMRHVLDGILIRELAEAQERAASIRVADAISTLRDHMHVAKMNAGRLIYAHSRWERRPRTRYAIAVIIRNGEIATFMNFEGKRFRALPGLLLGLRCIDVPVLHVVKLDLVAHMVLSRQLVD